MYIEDLKVIKPSTFGPYTTIAAAIAAAATNNPPLSVWITSDYAGTDTYTPNPAVNVIDSRPSTTNSGRVGTVLQAVQAAAAANITAAAAANVFVTTLNAPGTSALEGVPFTVKASGYLSATAGTYTATVQPLIYASKSLGFTASAAAAIYSVAAVSVTVASAAVTLVPWTAQVTIEGDSTTGLLNAWVAGGTNNGAQQITALAAATNLPTSVSFTAATPLQFLAGVTTTGATLGAGSVVSLKSFLLEA